MTFRRCEWRYPPHRRRRQLPCPEPAVVRIYTNGEGYRCCELHWREAQKWRIQHMGEEATHMQRLST